MRIRVATFLSAVLVFLLLAPLATNVVAEGDKREILICAGCGLVIKTSYVSADGKFFHPRHLVCSHCKLKLDGDFVKHEGKRYHGGCFEDHVQLRCSLCSGTIESQYHFNLWGDTLHQVHSEQYEACEYCNRLISPELTNGGHIYEDGRRVCVDCSVIAVRDVTIAENLLDSMTLFLGTLGINIESEFELRLVDRREMLRRSGSVGSEALGFAEYKQKSYAFGLVKSKRIKIYILYGLPEIIFRTTVAHELMHVWQYANAPHHNNSQWSEGSCQYAAYLYLKTRSDTFSKFVQVSMDQSEDELYGIGFRLVREFAEEHGNFTWLEKLKADKNPPWDH